jgi:tRNA(Ile)-lysidine synthase
VAHTRDDLLETVLMRVLRGSGPAGLAAMPVRRGRILRPLLEFSRAEVLRYLEEKNISHRIDRTNTDNRFLRNVIRNRLIPLLDDLFPRWRGRLQSLAETQRLAADFLAAEAKCRVQWEERAGELRTGAAGFFSQPAILREEALFLGIDRLLSSGSSGRGTGKADAGNPPQVKRQNLRNFSRGDCTALDLGSCRVRRTSSRVILAGADPGDREAGFSLLIKAPGSYKLREVSVEVLPDLNAGHRETAAHGFYAALPLTLRAISGGDTFFRGGRKIIPGDLNVPPGAAVFCAVDAFGPAAFITLEPGGGLAVSGRDGPEAQNSGKWKRAGGNARAFYYVMLRI